MVGNIVAAGLPASVAIEAVRLLARIVEGIDIVADNGRELLCAFIASPELHDALCIWGASHECDEPEGDLEDDYRANPRAVACPLPEVVCERPAPRLALPAPVPDRIEPRPVSAFPLLRRRSEGGLMTPAMLAHPGARYFEAVARSAGQITVPLRQPAGTKITPA